MQPLCFSCSRAKTVIYYLCSSTIPLVLTFSLSLSLITGSSAQLCSATLGMLPKQKPLPHVSLSSHIISPEPGNHAAYTEQQPLTSQLFLFSFFFLTKKSVVEFIFLYLLISIWFDKHSASVLKRNVTLYKWFKSLNLFFFFFFAHRVVCWYVIVCLF